MRLLEVAAAVAALVSLCEAIPSASNYVLHEKRATSHNSITKRSKLDARSVLPIRIGLTQRDLHMGYDWLMDVSHPESDRYGKHWTAEEVNKAFAPTAETVQAVRDWLMSTGVADERITVSDNKGWLAFESTVEEAEKLFKADFYQREHHKDEAKYMVGCDE